MNMIVNLEALQFLLMVSLAIYFLRDAIIEKAKQLRRGYNVAEIKLRGPIKEQKDAITEEAISSSNVVKKLRNLKQDKHDAIIININTPGGSPVPSDDIRKALQNIEIPVYTYTRSLCASGGYMIACGTDHIHARQDSLIGSIGVIGSQHKLNGLAQKYGIEYERFVGGDHKDTHRPFKELNDEERRYWQSIIDQSYENFVDIVSKSRGITKKQVKDTDAEILNANDALEKNLVDTVGSRKDLKDKIKSDTGLKKLNIRQSNGGSMSFNRVDASLANLAYSFGKGIASVIVKSDKERIEYRI